MRKPKILGLLIVSTALMIGCEEDENARLAEMAERNSERQYVQSRQMAELQRQVAAEQAEAGRQRDILEAERRALAGQRWRDPIIATAIMNAGLLIACLLPLLLCWQLLRRRDEPADDALVAEVLIEDLVARKPLLLLPQREALALDHQHEEHGADAGEPGLVDEETTPPLT